MSSRNRQIALLVVLLVTFVWLIGRQLGSGLPGGGAPSARRAAVVGGSERGSDAMEVAELRLEALEHKPASYQPGRDPFRFGQVRQPAPPPPPKPTPDPDAARRRAEAAQRQRQRQQQQPQPRPAQPQPPKVDFVYLGSFGLPGREIAVFSDGKEILNAFAGDVLRQEFVVRSIGFESADIGFVNFPDAPAERLAVGG